MRFLVALFILALAVPARAEINPVYGKLKAYRTYVSIANVGRTAHHFYVWFQDIEPCLAQISGDTVAEMGALTEDDLHMSWGGLSLPPDSVDPLPAPVADLGAAALKRIQELHPDATSFKIMYCGRFRTVRVIESTPHSLPGDPNHRLAGKVETGLRVMEDGSIQGTYGFSMAGYGLLAYETESDHFASVPTFVDYRMPAELEGTSALYTPIFARRGAYEDAYQALTRKIVQTLAEMDAGTYENPIDRLLASQGETQLPPGYTAQLTVGMNSYARHEEWSNQVDEYPRFTVSARDALAGPVTQSVKSERTGMTYEMTLDLKARKVAFRVMNSAGQSQAAVYPVRENEAGGIVVEGDSVGVMSGGLTAQIPEEERELSVPGTGGFSEFDVYPEASMWVQFVNKPCGGQIQTKNADDASRHGKRLQRSK